MDIVDKIESYENVINEATNSVDIQWDVSDYEDIYHMKPEQCKEPMMWEFKIENEDTGRWDKESRLSRFTTFEKAKKELILQLKKEYKDESLIVHVNTIGA